MIISGFTIATVGPRRHPRHCAIQRWDDPCLAGTITLSKIVTAPREPKIGPSLLALRAVAVSASTSAPVRYSLVLSELHAPGIGLFLCLARARSEGKRLGRPPIPAETERAIRRASRNVVTSLMPVTDLTTSKSGVLKVRRRRGPRQNARSVAIFWS
jgi:hypothetical protein